MTHPPLSPRLDQPRPGDVVFVYSRDKCSVGSCILQRFVLHPSRGPWFSHAAVTVNDQLVIEASTAPDTRESTWSGAVLGGGVRLQLIPDLLNAVQKYVVLRHPDAPDVVAGFHIQHPIITLLLGGGYSIEDLVDGARKSHAFLDAVIPNHLFAWTAERDEIARSLRDDPELLAGIKRHLQEEEALGLLNDYFCSQLAGTLLARLSLAAESPELETPCTLFDRLVAAGWRDVTHHAYEPMMEYWQGSRDRGENWNLIYRKDVAIAGFARESALVKATVSVAAEKLDTFGANLKATCRKLMAMNRGVSDINP